MTPSQKKMNYHKDQHYMHRGDIPGSSTRSDEDRLWYALDMDEGMIAVARTRREVMRLANVPLRREWFGRWERHIYGPCSEEIQWSYRDEETGDSVFIEHGLGGLQSGGWEHRLTEWRNLGSPVGVRIDEMGMFTG